MKNPISVDFEDKQEFLDNLCETLQYTSGLGSILDNHLVKLQYVKDDTREFVRPIFADGYGSNGEEDVNVHLDNNIGMLIDITNHFVRKF